MKVNGLTVRSPEAVRFTLTLPVNPLIALASNIKSVWFPAAMSKVVGVAVSVKFGMLTTFSVNCEVCVWPPFALVVTVTGVEPTAVVAAAVSCSETRTEGSRRNWFLPCSSLRKAGLSR